MDTIEPGRVHVVPIGFARARRWCSDLWESTASTTMVFILLSVLLSYYLGTADHSDGAQAVELNTQDDAVARAWDRIGELYEVRITQAIERHDDERR